MSGIGGGSLDGPRGKPKPTFSPEVQRQAMILLVGGGFVFLLLVLGAFYVAVMRPTAQRSGAEVRPVIEAYLQAGRNGSAHSAHRLFSEAGIRTTPLEQIAAAFEQRDLYEGFEAVRIRSFERLPGGSMSPNELARAEGIVLYAAPLPAAAFSAELEREREVWRLRWIQVQREPADVAP